jgi:hypothetical protein
MFFFYLFVCPKSILISNRVKKRILQPPLLQPPGSRSGKDFLRTFFISPNFQFSFTSIKISKERTYWGVWQTFSTLSLFFSLLLKKLNSKYSPFFFFFFFFFIFYIISIIFYYYSNKKTHYKTKLFHFSIKHSKILYHFNHFLLLFKQLFHNTTTLRLGVRLFEL